MNYIQHTCVRKLLCSTIQHMELMHQSQITILSRLKTVDVHVKRSHLKA